MLLCDWTRDANVTRVALERRLEAAPVPTAAAILGLATWVQDVLGEPMTLTGAYHASTWTTHAAGRLLGRHADKVRLVTGQAVLASDYSASGYLHKPIPTALLGGAAVLDGSSRVLGVAVASSAERGWYAGLDEADEWIRRNVPTSYAAAQRVNATGHNATWPVHDVAAVGGVPE